MLSLSSNLLLRQHEIHTLLDVIGLASNAPEIHYLNQLRSIIIERTNTLTEILKIKDE